MRDQSQTSVEDARPARLPVVALLLLALLALGVPLISPALNLVDVFAFPLGYFMVAQGSLIALMLVGIASARWQDRRRRATDT